MKVELHQLLLLNEGMFHRCLDFGSHVRTKNMSNLGLDFVTRGHAVLCYAGRTSYSLISLCFTHDLDMYPLIEQDQLVWFIFAGVSAR